MDRQRLTLGIDFGTSTTKLAWYNSDKGAIETLKYLENQCTSSVAYFGKDGEWLIGNVAEKQLEDPTQSMRVVSRMTGSAIKQDLAHGTFSFIASEKDTSDDPVFEYWEILAEILKQLKQNAEGSSIKQKVTRVVMTYGANADSKVRERLVQAANKAGFTECKLLSEPEAAAYAYAYTSQVVRDEYIITYDLGGVNCVLSLLRFDAKNKTFTLIDTKILGDEQNKYGGETFDQLLYDDCNTYALKNEELKQAISIDDKIDFGFLRSCHEHKHLLTAAEKNVWSTRLSSNNFFRRSIDRKTFEDLIRTTIQKTGDETEKFWEKANEKYGTVTTILMVGGSSRIPLVQKVLRERFKDPVRVVTWEQQEQQELLVAYGAAFYAHSLADWAMQSAVNLERLLTPYRQQVEVAWADRFLDDAEAALLTSLVKELDLDDDQAIDLERAIMGETKEGIVATQNALDSYRKALEGVQTDRQIGATTIQQLSALARSLGLTDNQTTAIESEVLKGTKEDILGLQRPIIEKMNETQNTQEEGALPVTGIQPQQSTAEHASLMPPVILEEAALTIGEIVGKRYQVMQVQDVSSQENVYMVRDLQSYRRCRYCGSENDTRSREYCSTCGSKLENESAFYVMHEYKFFKEDARIPSLPTRSIIDTFTEHEHTYIIINNLETDGPTDSPSSDIPKITGTKPIFVETPITIDSDYRSVDKSPSTRPGAKNTAQLFTEPQSVPGTITLPNKAQSLSFTLIMKLSGHTQMVNALAFSQTGHWFVSGSADKTVGIWNAYTGEQIHACTGHKGAVTTVALSPDGRRIASGSADGTIIIWDTATRVVVHELHGHEKEVHAVAFSSDGLLLVSGGADKIVRLWEPQSGLLLQTLLGHQQAVRAIALSRDRQIILSASEDKTIKSWYAGTGELMQTFVGHTKGVFAIALSPDQTTLISGGADNKIKLWNFTTGKEQTEFSSVGSRFMYTVNALAFGHYGGMFASAHDYYTLAVWDRQALQLVYTFTKGSSSVKSLAISNDEQYIVAGGGFADTSIKVLRSMRTAPLVAYKPYTFAMQSTLNGDGNQILSLAFSPDGLTLASGSNNTTIQIWNTQTRKVRWLLRGHMKYVWSLAFSRDGQTLASASSDNTVKVWNTNTGTLLYTLSFSPETTPYPLVISPDGAYLMGGGPDSSIVKWNLRTGEKLHTIFADCKGVTALALHPYTGMLVSGGRDGTIKVWDREKGTLLRTLVQHTRTITALAIHQNELISSSRDKTINVWDIYTGKLLYTFVGYSTDIHTIAITPDGSQLISGSNEIKRWNLLTGELLNSTVEHVRDKKQGVYALAMSQDGRMLASGGIDASVKIWQKE